MKKYYVINRKTGLYVRLEQGSQAITYWEDISLASGYQSSRLAETLVMMIDFGKEHTIKLI
jgi:hypothetical protein